MSDTYSTQNSVSTVGVSLHDVHYGFQPIREGMPDRLLGLVSSAWSSEVAVGGLVPAGGVNPVVGEVLDQRAYAVERTGTHEEAWNVRVGRVLRVISTGGASKLIREGDDG